MYNIDLDNISKILKKLNECKKKKKVRCCLYLMYKKKWQNLKEKQEIL